MNQGIVTTNTEDFFARKQQQMQKKLDLSNRFRFAPIFLWHRKELQFNEIWLDNLGTS